MIATGRMYQTARPVGLAMDIGDLPMILFSGGLVQRIESGEKLFEQTVDVSVANEILQLAKTNDWYVQSYIDDELLVHHETEESRMYEKVSVPSRYISVMRCTLHRKGRISYCLLRSRKRFCT